MLAMYSQNVRPLIFAPQQTKLVGPVVFREVCSTGLVELWATGALLSAGEVGTKARPRQNRTPSHAEARARAHGEPFELSPEVAGQLLIRMLEDLSPLILRGVPRLMRLYSDVWNVRDAVHIYMLSRLAGVQVLTEILGDETYPVTVDAATKMHEELLNCGHSWLLFSNGFYFSIVFAAGQSVIFQFWRVC